MVRAPDGGMCWDVAFSTCGHYSIPYDTVRLGLVHSETKHLLSAATRQSWESMHTPLRLDSESMQQAVDRLGRLTVPDKMVLLLEDIARGSGSPGKHVRVSLQTDYPVAACKDREELILYLEHLMEQGSISEAGLTNAGWGGHLTVEGWQKLEEKDRGASTAQAFVAMWFDDAMNAVFRDGIEPGISRAGYKPFLVNMKQHNEKIDDHIIAEIRRSRFLVVDVTGARTAVYFEAGFAKGLGIPVIWLCKDDDEEIKGMSFDTRQFNHITWCDVNDGLAKLRETLSDRIVATIGQGPLPLHGE